MKKKRAPKKLISDKNLKPRKIEKLEVCRSAPHAEMSRNTDKDEPCDDGRAGK